MKSTDWVFFIDGSNLCNFSDYNKLIQMKNELIIKRNNQKKYSQNRTIIDKQIKIITTMLLNIENELIAPTDNYIKTKMG